MDIDRVHESDPLLLSTCPQFIAITPSDHKSWPSLKQRLQSMVGENYSSDKFLLFVEGRYREKGYANVRLLRKIKTQYFWASAVNFMLSCLVNDTEQLSCQLNVLNGRQNTTLKLTKHQVFLILGHMLIGTFPAQLQNDDVSLGPFMTVHNDEDQVTSREILEYRLNKLKSIAKYFCVYKKRSQQSAGLTKQVLIFQRAYLDEAELDVMSSNARLCKVNVTTGDLYEEDRELNKMTINNVSLIQAGQVVQEPIPGFNIYNDEDLHVEQRIFFSHPELLILPAILHRGLGKSESFVVHGAQKYCKYFAISKYSQFDFKARYFDESKINKVHNFKNTTLIFVAREIYTRKIEYRIVPDILKVCSALKCCSQVRSVGETLMSGKFTPVKKYKEKISPHRIQIPWEIKFLVDWIAASIMKFTDFSFCVEDGLEAADIRILAKEMKDYTFSDIVGILEDYHEFRKKEYAKLDFIQFLKDFVL